MNVSITSSVADVQAAIAAVETECAQQCKRIHEAAKAEKAARRESMRAKVKALRLVLAVVEPDATGGHAAVEKAAAEALQEGQT